MLKSFCIENYRGFKSFQLDGLARVNLFVGRNNSGKSSILECIQLLATGGDPAVLVGTARRRGETVSTPRDDASYDFSHFFHGHDIQPGSRLALTPGNGLAPVSVEVQPVEDMDVQSTLFEELKNARPAYALAIQGPRSELRSGRPLILADDGALLFDPRFPRRMLAEERREGPPVVFIAPDSGASIPLGAMWNQVLRDKQEGEIKKAMQILEPSLEDIVFQSGDSAYRVYDRSSSIRPGVLASVAGDPRRVPLGSMGDGMRRLLALSISLVHSKAGFLIIDEIDTGFHYSIMAKMWELVVRTAAESGIQVFATTHSLDCVRGLGAFCKHAADLQGEVAAHKIENGSGKNVAFGGADVINILENEIEIR